MNKYTPIDYTIQCGQCGTHLCEYCALCHKAGCRHHVQPFKSCKAKKIAEPKKAA